MEYSAGCCCGNPSQCPCSLEYTSITVKWNGLIRLDPMTCVEYNKQNIEVEQSTGFDQSRCRLQSRMEPIGSVVYGSISHVFQLIPDVCTYTTTREVVVQQRSRYVSPSCATPANPLGYPCEPGRICANELVFDAFHRIYVYKATYQLTLSLPFRSPSPFIPDRPKWGVQVRFDQSQFDAAISFTSTDPDWSCTPTSWTRSVPDFMRGYDPDGLKCWPLMGVTIDNLTPDPDWSTYIHPVSTCYVLNADFGSVQVG